MLGTKLSLPGLTAEVNGVTIMRDDERDVLREVETTQEALKRNIEESARLIDQAQDAVRRFRETRDREDAKA
jgi:hypothetical protein